MKRFRHTCLFIMLSLLCTQAFAEDPEQVLKDKGLEAVGNTWVLPIDKDINKEMSSVRKLYGDARRAEANARTFDKKIRRVKQQIAAWEYERERLAKETRKAMTSNKYNRIVEKVNELETFIDAAKKERSEREDEMNAELSEALGNYASELIDFHEKVVWAENKYQELAKDEAVTAALKALSDKEQREQTLGPSSMFDRQAKVVTRMREEIKAGEITLEKEHNTLWVDVAINGKNTRQMVLDTGASFLSLPHDFANDLEIVVGSEAQDIQVSLADGKIVDAKLVMLESVQIGQFVVKDVEAVVLPEHLIAATPLLGNSYLKNFVFRVDPEKGKLRLTEKTVTVE